MGFKVGDWVIAKPGKHLSHSSTLFSVEEGKPYKIEEIDSHRRSVSFENGPLGCDIGRFILIDAKDFSILEQIIWGINE